MGITTTVLRPLAYEPTAWREWHVRQIAVVLGRSSTHRVEGRQVLLAGTGLCELVNPPRGGAADRIWWTVLPRLLLVVVARHWLLPHWSLCVALPSVVVRCRLLRRRLAGWRSNESRAVIRPPVTRTPASPNSSTPSPGSAARADVPGTLNSPTPLLCSILWRSLGNSLMQLKPAPATTSLRNSAMCSIRFCFMPTSPHSTRPRHLRSTMSLDTRREKWCRAIPMSLVIGKRAPPTMSWRSGTTSRRARNRNERACSTEFRWVCPHSHSHKKCLERPRKWGWTFPPLLPCRLPPKVISAARFSRSWRVPAPRGGTRNVPCAGRFGMSRLKSARLRPENDIDPVIPPVPSKSAPPPRRWGAGSERVSLPPSSCTPLQRWFGDP